MDPSANPDEIRLTTLGFDVGSSTSHLTFSEVVLRRSDGPISSKFVVVARRTIWSSPITLTPYDARDRIDQDALVGFMRDQYRDAGITPDDIETGAVILTGNALLRENSRAVGEVLAIHSGRLVCASAGHDFEARLAARGSGAVALSLTSGQRMLNVDIGGGTTKFALLAAGEIIDTAALGWGARLTSWDAARRIRHLHPTLAALARRNSIEVAVGQPLSVDAEDRLATAMAREISDFIIGDPASRARALELLLRPLQEPWTVDAVSFSGGVSEYIRDPAVASFNDLGSSLGKALRRRWSSGSTPPAHLDHREGIRATVVGAGQYSTQVSGSTIHTSHPAQLPITSVPVVRPSTHSTVGHADLVALAIDEAIDRDAARTGGRLPAIAISWEGPPEYARLRSLADGLARALETRVDDDADAVIVVDEDIAQSLGRILTREIGVPFGVFCLDGVDLAELDYLDIGEVMEPAGVIPLVVKSLLFPPGDDESIHPQGHPQSPQRVNPDRIRAHSDAPAKEEK